MIDRKYKNSMQRRNYSESIDTFQKCVWFNRIYLCCNIFKNWLSGNTKIPRDVKLIPKVSTVFQSICWFRRIYLCFDLFKNYCPRIPRFHARKFFVNARRYQYFWRHSKKHIKKWNSVGAPNSTNFRSSRKLRYEQ